MSDAPGGGAAAGLGPRPGAPAPETPEPRGPLRSLVLGAAALIALAALVAGVLALADAGRDRREREDAARRTAAEAEAARLRRVQAPKRGAARALRPEPGSGRAEVLRARAALVRAAEASILADARGRARRRELRGPIAEVRCGPIARRPDAVPDDRVPGRPIGRYDCLAVRRTEVDAITGGTASLGYPFVAALDFRRFTYVWCRNTPPQSERGRTLAVVRLERACLAARGRPVGTGYADVPDP
jgi:hypothetical protein